MGATQGFGPSGKGHAPQHPLADSPFAPKTLDLVTDGYSVALFRRDAVAGLTVAIVALPLSMAIAIASGASPQQGLYTAIIGGFLISLLSGSRHQIGGPAGAFIVLVAATIERYGYDGLLLATMMAGAMMIVMGLLRLGRFVRLMPSPVILGFTAGIGVIIFASQIKDLLGLTLNVREPAMLLPKLSVLASALPSLNATAFALALLSIFLIVILRLKRPNWPGFLIAVLLASAFALLLSLPVETIGSRFGGVPSSLPAPAIPPWSVEKLVAILPSAIAIAVLGAVESLLSAVVADNMADRRHRPNTELVAQGIGNIGTALFGGITATGTIARTATNIKSGAHGPVSGMLHAVYLLAFMLLAAPLLSLIPLAALAGILAVVCWNMIERHAIAAALKRFDADAMILLVTFFVTIFRDLIEGIAAGIALALVAGVLKRIKRRAT